MEYWSELFGRDWRKRSLKSNASAKLNIRQVCMNSAPGTRRAILRAFCSVVAVATAAVAQEAELILHHGKVVTVDQKFSLSQAVAIKEGRILGLGSNDDMMRLKGARTEL